MKLPTSGEQQKATPEEPARPAEPASRGRAREEEPARDEAPPSRRTPVAVDQVGDAAVRIAARAWRKSGVCPKVTVPSRVLASAKLTKREAFVASLLDGDLTLSEIVEASGMTEATVTAAIRELVRLGLAKL